ncbi:hypothetical protein [Halobacterium bonnevillei]|uniref:Uncharacterized protein n=1 Tax=Halobacterium bonnevillei TaxID=2692200 RepID=A0A6B0SF80_9EURY|nr:hypothetical protein [Halobacterium bonnevillei]MXR20424.1 hypothetical protein [Halobacterium bonnevillei]
MLTRPSLRGFGAALVVGVALLCMGVIALGFLMPERLFESTVGLVAFFAAGLLIVVCAVVANLYDLRGILYNEFG